MARPLTIPTRLLAVTTALALLAGCTPPGADDGATPTTGGAAGTASTATTGVESTSDDTTTDQTGSSAEDTPEGLEDFYSQTLAWTECEIAFECATLSVPIDYTDPSAASIELALLRSPAPGDARGSLVVNPGGPGVSGVDYAMAAPAVVPEEILSAFDVVGFDPRGVARSAPITCYTDQQLDDYLGADPSPDDAAEEDEADARLQDFAEACDDNAGELLGHVSTVEAAKDMDVLRAALGQEQLTYLGASYGTLLGATYASLFPERVGRFVLDGAVDPGLSELEMGLGQATGFERATRAYVEDCVAVGGCPLGDDVDTAMLRIPAFLEELDADPLPVQGDVVDELTEGWGVLGIVMAMYAQDYWPILTQALEQAEQGDGTLLMFLANTYVTRSADGDYRGNLMQAISAVNCLDRPGDTGGEDLDSDAVQRRFEEVSPTWGRYLAGEGACQYWPVEAVERVDDYAAEGAAPILVIGTTRDPATPHEWAVALAETLDSGVLISYDGDGHTAYGRSNECVDDAVDAYLLEGTVPEDDRTC
ncbi:alpha/beta hydrolase [Ornithinimicrobium sp. LYQ103]|uniref:alpha/beta hydrolase n=1 Tax=Ornithinimicrobium sp. LYQ103 TaxID=3378796 RepID=UPI00385337DE